MEGIKMSNLKTNSHLSCLANVVDSLVTEFASNSSYRSDHLYKIKTKYGDYAVCGGEIETAQNGSILGLSYKCCDCPFFCISDEQFSEYEADLEVDADQNAPKPYFDISPIEKINLHRNFPHKIRIKNDAEIYDALLTLKD